MKNIIELRDAAAVTRYHTMRTHRTQSLAEHSYGVAQLALYINPASSAALLSACLWHDLAEIATGDIPAYVKWNAPEIKPILKRLEHEFEEAQEITPHIADYEQHILKWCDGMELILWCREETELGNAHPDVRWAISKVMKLLTELGHPTAKAEELYNYVKERSQY